MAHPDSLRAIAGFPHSLTNLVAHLNPCAIDILTC